MKILVKNGYKFASGLDIWQIPDENKSSLQIGKTASMFKTNMYCYTKRLSLPTYGFTFCNEKGKVASLGLYILEASAIDKKYKNVVICYKFKSAGSLDDGGEIINDLYGYLFILNGTICPDKGEDIGEYDDVHSAIYQILTKYEIHVLYLTSDVANKFFNIFERLNERKRNIQQVEIILTNSTLEQLTNLKNVLEDINMKPDEYLDLYSFRELSGSRKADLLKQIQADINKVAFEDYANNNRSTIRHLTERLQVVDYTSEELYWNNKRIKQIYRNAELRSVNAPKKIRERVFIGVGGAIVALGIFYYFKPLDEEPKIIKRVMHSNVAMAVSPLPLIKKCVLDNDHYFKDLGKWTLTGIRCDSTAAKLFFSSELDSTVDEFIEAVGTDKGMSFGNRSAQILSKYDLTDYTQNGVNTSKRVELISNLQTNAKELGYTINFSGSNFQKTTSFLMASQVSPLFLYNKNLLKGVRLKLINMSFDKNTGLYHWNIQGEI